MPKPKKKTTLAKRKKPAVKSKKVAKKSATKLRAKKVKVSPIPKGYNTLTAYLIVNNGKKAIDFYKQAFGAKEIMRMEQPNGKIAHAELKIGDSKIMLADPCPEMGAMSPEQKEGNAFGIHLYVKNVDDVVKQAVKAGAEIKQAVDNKFYGDRSGAIKDPFGHNWYIATHVENVTSAQVKKRAAELFSKK